MAEYIIAYHGGGEMPEDPEAHQARFMAWIADLGDAVVNPGTPLGPSKMVTSEGVSDEGGVNLMGFSVVKADSLEAAVEIARTCPFLEIAPVEVAEAKQM